MAASGSCFLCNAAYSPVWRRDKATGQTICNRCYRNPAPEPSLDALSAENLFDDNDEFALSLAEDRPSNGSTEDRTRKKRKHRERGWSEGGEGAGEVALPADMDLSTPAVETDTEYPAVDLETAPRKLHVQSSGSSKLDGSYWRMAGPSRGRPCYAKWTEKKPMYLFWNRKWFIGWDFGSAKSYAQLKDAGVLCPCEPYPKVWKVLDKHERKEKPGGGVDDDPAKGKRQYSDNLAMRVIDAAVLELAAEEGGVLGLLPSQEAKATRRSKHEAARTRPDRSVASSEKVPASASETRTLTAEEKAEQDALNAASSSDEDRPAVAPAEGSDEDSASDSSSEESSSSASASARPPSAERGQEQRPLEARQAKETPERRAQSMESKLKAELLKVPNSLARQQKFRTVRDMLLKKANGVDGMTPEKLQAVLLGIERWLAESARAEPAAARPAPAPAPGAAPARSALRRPGAPRQHDRRINFKDSSSLVKEVFVESHRALGETLWFYLPGSRVICDACEKEVLQSMGSLQGAPHQSQFAQCKFFCIDCSGM